MKRLPSRSWLLVLASGALVCCARGPGYFDVTLIWPNAQPPEVSLGYQLSARVEHRTDRRHRGDGVVEADERVPIGSALHFSAVPNRDDLVVVVEVHAPEDPPDLFAYYGVSELFRLDPGATVQQTVEMRRPPQSPPQGIDGIALEHRPRQVIGRTLYVPGPRVNLVLTTDTGSRVEISNLTGRAGESIELDGLHPSSSELAPSFSAQHISWNLDAGLGDPCTNHDYCRRQVFARFFDEFGYSSPSSSLQDIVVDTQNPVVTRVQVDPASATLSDTISVSFQLTEPVRASELALTIAGREELPVQRSSPGPDEESTSFTYLIPAGELGDGSYELAVSAVDFAGNAIVAERIGSIDIDATVPRISSDDPRGAQLHLQPTTIGPDRPRFEISFRTSEPLEEDHVHAWFDGTNFPCVRSSDLAWRCAHAPSIDPGTLGPAVIRVDVSDRAGNSSFANTTVMVDYSSPTVKFASLALRPAASNILRTVQSATAGTTALLSFTLSKPVTLDPIVTGVAPDRSRIRFTRVDQRSGTAPGSPARTFTYLHSFVPGEPSGSYDIEVAATDPLGNSSTTSVLPFLEGPLFVDQEPPKIHALDRVVYRREPFGSDASGGRPRYSISGAPGAVDPGALVIAYDRQGTEIGLGRSFADAQGGFPALELRALDLDEVLISVADEAGNESLHALVSTVDWVTTLGRGSELENLSRIEIAPALATAPRVSGATVLTPELDALARSDDRSLTATAALVWKKYPLVPEGPSLRAGHAMAYDPVRGRVIMFGGETLDTDVWELGDIGWSRIAGTADPVRGASMIFDGARGVIAQVGGSAARGILDQCLEWTDGSWGAPSRASVCGRAWSALAYDASRGVATMFGGRAVNQTLLGDTVELIDQTWTSITSTRTPTAREKHAMAYDSRRHRTVLFGGRDASGALGDTWEWDGYTWYRRTPSLPPAPRFGHAMAYDSRHGTVVLFGGENSAGRLGDTWEWNGSTWRQAAGTGPAPRSDHAIAYDSGRERLVLFGGTGESETYADTWERWQGEWHERITGDPLDTAADPVVAHDSLTAHTVLVSPRSDRATLGVWLSAGDGWTAVPADAADPPARSLHALTFDNVEGKAVLFGGRDGASDSVLREMWLWSSFGGWEQVYDGHLSPRERVALAGSTDGRLLLFGGADLYHPSLSDTWKWSGSLPGGTWTSIEQGDPTQLSDPIVAFDSGLGIYVLAGADGRVFERSGSTWDSAGALPTPEMPRALAYDSVRERMMLVASDGVWSRSGLSWRPEVLAGASPFPASRSVVYDDARRELVLVATDAAVEPGVFRLGLDPDQRPSLLARLHFAPRASPGNAPPERSQVRALSLAAAASGLGDVSISGAEMRVWNAYDARWTAEDSNSAAPASSARLSFETRSAAEAQRYLDRAGRLYVRFQPRAGSGAAEVPSRVDLDYVELTVRYRIDVAGPAGALADGTVDPSLGESCDDGNNDDTDGCTRSGVVRPGWSCDALGSPCTPCGNGVVEGAEECDDGNLINGDGCNDGCRVEASSS